MEIKKFNIDGIEVTFVNKSYDTRSGFKHVTNMFTNDYGEGTNTCYYYNRTWECYRYQTVMCGCVRNLIEIRIENLKSNFKFENGYLKMTAKRNEEFEKYIANDAKLKFYNKLLDKLK